MLSSLTGKTHGNLLTRAAQAVQAERRRELEQQELREEQRKNPLTPIHILQQRIRRRGSSDLGFSFRDSLESPFNAGQNVSSTRSEVFRSDYFGHGNWTSSASSGGQTPSAKHIHFNDRVEQCIAVEIKDDEDSTAIEGDESEDEGLFIRSRHYVSKAEHSTIAKLPATTLRPGDDPVTEPPQVPYNVRSLGSRDDLNESSGFFYEEGGGFSSSASPPEFPPRPFDYEQEEPIDDFSFDHPFTNSENGIPSNTTSTTSSRRSSDFGLEEESQGRASVSAIPIPTATRALCPKDHGGMMGEEEDDEGIGIVGLAADAISTAKDLVGVLWNAGWGVRR
jgi:hypothetical protein